MKVEREKNEFRVTLTATELQLLRRALERASFVDTPASEQERILSFCADALAELEKAQKKG
jgi:hypothetical protein